MNSSTPPLKFPTFNGKYNEFNNCYVPFKQIIENEPSFTAIKKFNYLLSWLWRLLSHCDFWMKLSQNIGSIIERSSNSVFMFNETVTELFNMHLMTKQNTQQLRHLMDKTSKKRKRSWSIRNFVTWTRHFTHFKSFRWNT